MTTAALTHSGRPTLWHSQGHVVPDGSVATAQELLEAAGLDWDVGLTELYTQHKGNYETAPKQKAIVRTDTGQVLGIARSRYVPIPNRDVLSFLDNLQDSGDALFESAWSARGGEAVGITMRLANEVKIAGRDPHQIYLLATTTHDGGGSCRVDATPLRISCTNMVNLAKKQAVRTYRAVHTKSLQMRVMEAREALDVVFNYVQEYDAIATRLVEEKATERLVRKFAEELYGEKHLEKVVTHWKNAANLDGIRDTKYGALNALTEYGQWGRTRNPGIESAIRGGLARTTERAFELVAA